MCKSKAARLCALSVVPPLSILEHSSRNAPICFARPLKALHLYLYEHVVLERGGTALSAHRQRLSTNEKIYTTCTCTSIDREEGEIERNGTGVFFYFPALLDLPPPKALPVVED